MKVPEEYGGLGLSQVYYNRALALAGTWHAVAGHAALGAPVDRRRRAAAAVRLRGAEAEVAAAGRQGPHLGVPAHRARRRLRPGAPRLHRRRRPSGGYLLNGRKLWATNGAIADIVVVMAQVPKCDGHRGGISAFVLDYTTDGVTVEQPQPVHGPARHRELGHASRGRLRAGGEPDRQGGPGPQDRPLDAQHRPPRAARDLRRQRQVGDEDRARVVAPSASSGASPVGKHDAVAQKIAFIAATAFGLEAMLDVASPPRRRQEERHPHRGRDREALRAPRSAGRSLDELMQIRGGRGYETAESLKARGEKPVPVEQALRDMRINRIFEGSTEIMHLLIAREAVDQHLQVAGDILEGDGDLVDEGQGRASARASSTPSGSRALTVGEGHEARLLRRVRRAGHAPALRRAPLAQARPHDVLRDGPLAGQAREEAGVPRPDRRHRRRAVRDRVGGVYANTIKTERPDRARAGLRARRPVLQAGARAASTGSSTSCGPTTTTPTTPPRRPCSTAATRGSRRASPTRRATGR